MEYTIHLENFDGPMDLLLHLVKMTKLDIYDINMSEIIENYLNYIKSLQELNIDIGGEFILMASSLVHLKSKLLIGKTKDDEEKDGEFDIESEEDLKNKILEYEKYKRITKELQNLEEKRSEIFTKIPESLKEYALKDELVNEYGITADALAEAFLNLEKRLHYKEPVETRITRKEISIKDQVLRIRYILKEKKRCYFEELFEFSSKDYIIATFLAILEMSKKREINLFQNDNFKQIEVEGCI